MLSFYVVNGLSVQNGLQKVSVLSDKGGPIIPRTEMDGHVLTMGTPVIFTASRVGQSSPYPSTRNTITITLGFNWDYRYPGAIAHTVTVSGLKNATATQGPVHLLGSHPFSRACWQCTCQADDAACDSYQSHTSSAEDASLTFYVKDNLSPGQSYIFSFEIKNPKAGQSAQILSVSTTFTSEPKLLEGDAVSAPKHALRGVAGEALPMFVRPMTFPVRSVVQTNSYPCQLNTMCVTLSISVPVRDFEDFAVTLSGFSGASHVGVDIKLFASSKNLSEPVAEFQSESGKASSGTWSQSAKTLTVKATCRLEADTLYSFCIQITNPPNPQAPPVLYLTNNLVGTLLIRKSILPAPSLLHYMGLAPDTQALYVRESKLLSFDVMSNSTQICHPNKLTFEFSVNLPMDSNCRIKIVKISRD
jgi:hypothetical protein